MVMLPDARAPQGLRIYAIGDVHGCTNSLGTMHRLIRDHLAHAPVPDWRIVHVGDYIDRGPDSRGAVAMLAALGADPRVVCLRGNHDQYLIEFLADPDADTFDNWLFNGGTTTLAEYGADPGEPVLVGRTRRRELHAILTAALPAPHRAFLDGLGLSLRLGDYLFVHAGLRPGVPLAAQTLKDLL
ncbi:MAG: metallophosphoesterase, partial [Thermohalobaculum sp.]|nr:metallophosphoesterase [Thermohalobaculum sp.]